MIPATTSDGLTSDRYVVSDYDDAMTLFTDEGWSDGLPVVPPTPERVLAFVDASGRRPSDIVGTMTERAARVTVEKLAVNAVMAGCLPEYMPVLVAAVQAVADPAFKFNHLASLGSPWPLIIVNGPMAESIGLNSGRYLFGPGSRPNLTIARALSLVLANCALARNDGIQRGQWGHPGRFTACIAENETTGWDPLHVQLGYGADDSTVTVASTYPNLPSHVTTVLTTPTRLLDAACHAISGFSGAQWIRGLYVLMIAPHHVDIFLGAGWSKEDVATYIRENTTATIADLKQRGSWGTPLEDLGQDSQTIHSGDEGIELHLFGDNGSYERFLNAPGDVVGRINDIYIVVAGGDAGHRLALAHPYSTSSNPVTVRIEQP